MNVWLRGQQFISLLNRKQQGFQRQTQHITHALLKLEQKHEECRCQSAALRQEVVACQVKGAVSRASLYEQQRRQAVLLSRQEEIEQQLLQLAEEREEHLQQLQHYQQQISALEKRQRKIDRYFHSVRAQHLRSRERQNENDIQEMANYVR
ncbi:hypothetical protein SGGMMB4_01306 [Sodalis glossinidius str. 'morsitans']|uniref:Type III secretion apparatus n=2 Tax=Sodalis glossinidius TaxID=63612 RepID=Q2NVI4_SODGM|nr:hypothetical protein [Sodalis glossinidius]AAS66843.1 YsaO [Sodalis glossinidius]BAE73841.1 type III secretion apparatus [Sodalis glossinidius str. 'morsitans']CRL44288.1 hypothetical protein SGGMMB4_01306 [Sodalis glossinidius str. 'morsitans']